MEPILVVSEKPIVHDVWTHLLRERGYHVMVEPWVSSEGESDGFMDPSLVIFDLDANTPLTLACAALEQLRRQYPAAPLVLLLPARLPEAYRRLFEQQSNGCLQKPVDYGGLLRLVDLFVVRQKEKRSIERGISQLLSPVPA